MPEQSQRRPYVAPRIEALHTATVGKHRVFDLSPSGGFAEAVDVDALLAEHGSPLYLLSENALRAQYRSLRDLFVLGGVRTQIAYSYKTNYLPAVCAIFQQEGAWAEVVSGMEYQLARALGVPGRQIVFNGPYKRDDELARAFQEGALVNIDGFDELDRVEALVVGNPGLRPRLGIRINFTRGKTSWTRFGFNHENGDARRALDQIAANQALELVALHNHSGTFQRDPDVYRRAAEVLIANARYARSLGLAPTVMDVGGGLPSDNRLKPEFDLPGEAGAASRLAPFARAVLEPLSQADGAFGTHPMLILEPGRALVDASMRLACTVVATKDIPDGGPALVIDAGVNLLPTAYWYEHGVDGISGRGEDRTEATGALRSTQVFGPLCMQIDCVRDNAALPPLQLGDHLLIDNVGAYNLTQSMQFIQPRPAVVMLGQDGPELVRRAERWQDLFALDRVPARLQAPGYELDD
ncbi:MAG: diaminopimelate decarboxylase [Gammaproteobacteria bacterium]|nr:diaminopimelate decarboxylase [Gammaproteobacteria bacterium]MCP5137964.1 diaminopimelate decarboxylase [Gammaproteobacteria bacterium]